MLIRNAEIHFTERADVRIANGIVVDIGSALFAAPDESVIDARGNALLPGLHDHHLHFMAYAAALDSVRCGPPQVADAEQLGRALRDRKSVV